MADDTKKTAHLFTGSIDRSRLDEMKAAAGDDPERQRIVAETQAAVDAEAESDRAAEDARQRAAGDTDDQRDQQERDDRQRRESSQRQQQEHDQRQAQEAQRIQPSQGEDLSALSKTDLVDRANAAGIDTTGKTKQELVDELSRQGR